MMEWTNVSCLPSVSATRTEDGSSSPIQFRANEAPVSKEMSTGPEQGPFPAPSQ
jgi:hypothetical protein